MPSPNILDSNTNKKLYNDPDSILIEIPSPLLIFDINSDTINLNGNFSLVPEVIRNAYTGVNVNTLQVFKLSKIYITFKVSNISQTISFNNTYVSTHDILTSSMFIINDNFNLPYDIDISNCNITSFKISANYVFEDNSLFSYITSTNSSISLSNPVSKNSPIVEITDEKVSAKTSAATSILDKLDFLRSELAVTDKTSTELYEKLESKNTNEDDDTSDLDRDINRINKMIEKLSTKSDDTSNSAEKHESSKTQEPDPYATLYWVIPLSIIVCIVVYTSYNYGPRAVKYFRRNRRISDDSDFSEY